MWNWNPSLWKYETKEIDICFSVAHEMCCFPSHHHDHLLTYLKGYLVHLTHNVTVREVNSF